MGARSVLSGLVLAAIMVVALSLGACSTVPREGSSPATSGAALADNKPYGNLTVASEFGAGLLDPPKGSGVTFATQGAAIFDSLLITLPNGQPGPGLAERWEIAPDGKSHTFYLRKGLKFNNGDPITAADAKFSIERMMRQDSIISEASIWRAAIARVEAKDDYTVVLQMKTAQFELLRATELGMTAVMPKKYIEEKGEEYFSNNLVGSGPWRVVSFTPGNKLEIEAIENHWRATPKFKTLASLRIPEEGTKIAMLKTGELDAALVSPDSVPGLRSAGLRIFTYDGGAKYFGKAFYDVENPDKYAFGSQKVRKAVQLAINAKEMATAMFGGAAEPYALYGVSPHASFWDSNLLKPDPYDPDGAKKLLAEAGYPNGFSTKLVDTGGGSILTNIHQAVQGYWRKIGVDTELVAMDYTAYRSLYVPKHNPTLWNTSFIMLAQDRLEFQSMPVHYHSSQSVYKNINNPRLDKLIEDVPATADPTQRKRLALEAAVLAKNDYSTLSILQIHNVMALGARVGEVTPFRDSKLNAAQFETFTHAR